MVKNNWKDIQEELIRKIETAGANTEEETEGLLEEFTKKKYPYHPY